MDVPAAGFFVIAGPRLRCVQGELLASWSTELEGGAFGDRGPHADEQEEGEDGRHLGVGRLGGVFVRSPAERMILKSN